MSIKRPVPAQDVDGRCRVEGEHLPVRPRWLCRNCGHPWPCGSARSALLTEYEGSRVGLSLYLAACLYAAIDDLRGLSVTSTGECADVFDRFLGWTRRRAAFQRRNTTDSLSLPKEAGS